MTRPTRSPVNGPGPTPTPIAVRSWRTSPASRERPVDQRRELLAVLQRLLGDQLGDHVVAVVEGDGDERRGGVEGEQHQDGEERPPVRGEPAVVVQQVERERRRPGLPDHRVGLGVQRHGRGQPPPISSGRPANVVAQACGRGRPAWPPRAGARHDRRQPLGVASRIGAISPRPMSTGGWCRQTNVGRSSRRAARPASRAGRRRARRGRSAGPSGADTSESSIRNRTPRPRAPVQPLRRAPASSPSANASRTSWLPVPTSWGRARRPGRLAPRRTPRVGRGRRRRRSTRSTSGRGSSASR